MTQLDDEALALLNQIAAEVRDVFEDRGYTIGNALSQDRAFRRSNRPKSSMTRELIAEGLEIGSARAGVWCDKGPGGSQEIHLEVLGRPCVFRLKNAKALSNGEYKIVTNNVSNWGDLDEETLIFEEPWALGYVLGKEGLAEIFAAKVLGITEGTPGVLILGPAVELGHRPMPSGGFVPAEEELEGFESESEKAEEANGGL